MKELIRIEYFTEAGQLLFRRKYKISANWPVKAFSTVGRIGKSLNLS